MNINLRSLDKNIRLLLISYIIVLTIGLLTGIAFLYAENSLSTTGTVEQFRGTEITNVDEEEFDIPEKYSKEITEMLLTTHNHLIGMSFIFLSIALIFHLNTIISGLWKTIIMVEPIISVLITFGSIWMIRYVHPGFVYLTILSALLMYIFYFIMASVSFYELAIAGNNK